MQVLKGRGQQRTSRMRRAASPRPSRRMPLPTESAHSGGERGEQRMLPKKVPVMRSRSRTRHSRPREAAGSPVGEASIEAEQEGKQEVTEGEAETPPCQVIVEYIKNKMWHKGINIKNKEECKRKIRADEKPLAKSVTISLKYGKSRTRMTP